MELPNILVELTDEQKAIVHDCFQFHDSFVIFIRPMDVSESQIRYLGDYMFDQIVTRDTTGLIVNLTGPGMLPHGKRKMMFQEMSRSVERLSHLAVVTYGITFRRIITEFFMRAYLSKAKIDVSFWQDLESAVVFLRNQPRT